MKRVIKSKVESSETSTTISAEQLVKANTKRTLTVALETGGITTGTTTTTIQSAKCESSTNDSISNDSVSEGVVASGGVLTSSPSSTHSDTTESSSRGLVSTVSSTRPNVFDFDPKVIVHPSLSTSPSDSVIGAAASSQSRDHLTVNVVAPSTTQRRRQSSPALTTGEPGERTFVDAEIGGDTSETSLNVKSRCIRRTGSFRVMKQQSLLEADYEDGQATRDNLEPIGNKSPWGRVKKIIHTRKDSLQKRSSVEPVSPESQSPPAVIGGSSKTTRLSPSSGRKSKSLGTPSPCGISPSSSGLSTSGPGSPTGSVATTSPVKELPMDALRRISPMRQDDGRSPETSNRQSGVSPGVDIASLLGKSTEYNTLINHVTSVT